LQAGPGPRVRQVDHHSDAVHLLDYRGSEWAEATVSRLEAAVTKWAANVVCDLHDPDPDPVEHFDQGRFVAQRPAALKVKKDSGLTGARGKRDIRCMLGQNQPIVMLTQE